MRGAGGGADLENAGLRPGVALFAAIHYYGRTFGGVASAPVIRGRRWSTYLQLNLHGHRVPEQELARPEADHLQWAEGGLSHV
ncbi:hypothetical protein MARHY0104 [Marinobacter nauticus ATCC 49840]|nr:hypothetical protein MARHY0104 [Marinobacter nauticus ATCC 49840]